jgi:hypothetical protein
METYRGNVRTPADAIKLFEACRRGLLPRVQRRLSEKERLSIRSGSVFVWDEREAGMRRWTDGKSWSASRVSGSFLTYREMEGRRGGGSFVSAPRRPSAKTDDDEADDGPDGYRYKPGGLMKQSFSITTSAGQHLHLISYHARPSPSGPDLLLPTADPALRHVTPPKGLYPEPALASAHLRAPPTPIPTPQRHPSCPPQCPNYSHPRLSAEQGNYSHPRLSYQHPPGPPRYLPGTPPEPISADPVYLAQQASMLLAGAPLPIGDAQAENRQAENRQAVDRNPHTFVLGHPLPEPLRTRPSATDASGLPSISNLVNAVEAARRAPGLASSHHHWQGAGGRGGERHADRAEFRFAVDGKRALRSLDAKFRI